MEKDIPERQETLVIQGEDAVKARLLTAFDALIEEELENIREDSTAPSAEHEFSDIEIIVMDSVLNFQGNSWDFPFMPIMMAGRIFDDLVDEGVLVEREVPEIDEDGRETGFIQRKFSRL